MSHIHQSNRVRLHVPKDAIFIIIRHGETALNHNDEIRGWLDVPLDEGGKKRAAQTGKELRNKGIYGLLASDLKRTRETAEIISKVSDIPILETAHWLRPWNVGKFTAKPVKEVIAEIHDYASEKPLTQIPDGESFQEFKNRFLEGIESARMMYSDKVIGLVTHHRNDRLFAAWEKEGCPKNKSIDFSVLFQEGIQPGHWRREGEQIETPKRDS